MSRFGQSVNDYSNGVKLVVGERQTDNEIHADAFPFPGRNTQGLEQSNKSHMVSLDPSTRVALRNNLDNY
jgi:hypothetical protein